MAGSEWGSKPKSFPSQANSDFFKKTTNEKINISRLAVPPYICIFMQLLAIPYKTSHSENLVKTPNIWKSINQLVDCWIRKKPVEPQINIFNQKLCIFSVPSGKEREGWSEKGRRGGDWIEEGNQGKMGECILHSVQCTGKNFNSSK